jgi:hypothetical protein
MREDGIRRGDHSGTGPQEHATTGGVETVVDDRWQPEGGATERHGGRVECRVRWVNPTRIRVRGRVGASGWLPLSAGRLGLVLSHATRKEKRAKWDVREEWKVTG